MGLLERIEKLEAEAGLTEDVPFEFLTEDVDGTITAGMRAGDSTRTVKEILDRNALGLNKIIKIRYVEATNAIK